MMFRPMLKRKKQLPEAECRALLHSEVRGVLSLLGDGDYPYGVPLNFWYSEEENCLYFHGGKRGHRVDAAQKHDKASFCVYDKGRREEGEWALKIRSVIVFGRLRVVTDDDKMIAVCRSLSHQFTRDEAYIAREIQNEGPHTLCYALDIEHMTGKRIVEA